MIARFAELFGDESELVKRLLRDRRVEEAFCNFRATCRRDVIVDVKLIIYTLAFVTERYQFFFGQSRLMCRIASVGEVSDLHGREAKSPKHIVLQGLEPR